MDLVINARPIKIPAKIILKIKKINFFSSKLFFAKYKNIKLSEHKATNKLSKITKQVIKNNSFINSVGDVIKKKFHFKKEDFHKNIHPEAYYTGRIFDFSFGRLSFSSNSFMAGNTSTSEDFGEGNFIM